jgi:hypothetical protein
MGTVARQAQDIGDQARELKDKAERGARHAIHAASPWIAILARAGYAAKGVVYVLVGVLALTAAFGGGHAEGSRGALGTLLGKPFGKVILAVIAAGLAGYALWCFVRAVWDPEREGTSAKAIGKRLFAAGKGVVHAALVVAVVSMLTGNGGGGGGGGDGDEGARDWTARLMAWPFGPWLVMLIGLAVVGYGVRQLYRGWKSDLDDQLNLGRMNATAARWTVRFSRFGIGARGVIFIVIGGFLALAGWRVDPGEAKGVGQALDSLQRQPYGPWLLGLVALGLIAYGLYEFVRAKYRRIDPT